MNKFKVTFIIVVIVIGFASFTMNSAAQDYTDQTNSTKSDKQKQKIIVTWLELNKTGDNPAIKVSSEDFWKMFGPLLERSGSKTAHLNNLD